MRGCFLILGLTFVAHGACSDDHDDHHGHEVPDCIEYELDGCMALYPATYDQVWTQTIEVSCASAGTACHAQSDAAGAEHGMTFADPQESWDHMIENDLVKPGDPLCSELFVRLATDDPEIRMPPGSSGISPEAVCSIGTWIADGAEFVAP
jgi:hypothetical protein